MSSNRSTTRIARSVQPLRSVHTVQAPTSFPRRVAGRDEKGSRFERLERFELIEPC